jgi:hypothetical protein
LFLQTAAGHNSGTPQQTFYLLMKKYEKLNKKPKKIQKNKKMKK